MKRREEVTRGEETKERKDEIKGDRKGEEGGE